MNCAETRNFLHAYADGELDLASSLEVERHLKSCAGCAAEKKSIQSLREALRQNDLAYHAPDSLRKEIRKMARASVEENRSRKNPWIWQWIAAGATAFAVLTILLRPAGISEHDQLLNEAVKTFLMRKRPAERALESTLARIRAYRKRDPQYRLATAAIVDSEASLADPLEGALVEGELEEGTVKPARPAQSRIREILGG